jgi:nucleoside-diphosphate-sugar epimerase
VTTPKTILVTGASGFIGRHAVASLAARGYSVDAVARDVSRIPDHPGVRKHAVDLLDPRAAADLVAQTRPAVLLHLAWYAEHGKFWGAPENLDWLSATLSLLRHFAAAGGARFVGAGTCAEYDWTTGAEHLDEALTPLRPATLYGAAKASAFLTGSAFAAGAGVSFAWGRVFHLFGEGEAPARLVPALIRAHLSGEPLECGRGETLRDLLPASAVADAFVHLCAAESGGAFNIGSGRGTSFYELSEKIARLAGSRGAVRFESSRDAGPSVLLPSTSRITDGAGWKPPETLENGLARAVGWWKARS